MTFYEAAVEVLREAGRPLHVRKITEQAVARGLLTHIGKTPEQTMAARLQQECRKPAEQTLVTLVRAGIYALKEDVDLSEARETIRLHESEVEPEPVEGAPGEGAPDGAEAGPVVVEPPASGRAAGRRGRGRDRRATGAAVTVADASGEAASVEITREDEAPSDAPGEEDALEDAEAGLGLESAAAEGEAPGSEDDQDANGERRRRRRGRRGGRNRQRSADGVNLETEGVDDSAEGDEEPAPVVATATREADATPPVGAGPAAHPVPAPPTPRASTPPRAAGDAVPLAPTGEAEWSNLTAAIVQLLRERHDRADSLKALARDLSRRPVGALGRIGPAVVRAEVEQTNLRRSATGRPPLFEEVRPDVWGLASASGSELASSYGELDGWRDRHVEALHQTLRERLLQAQPAALATLLTLLLDRLGYQNLQLHPPLEDEPPTLSGIEPRALTRVRVAVRLLPQHLKATRMHVSELRGSLHHYDATEGVIVALAGVDEAAVREAGVGHLAPVTLLHARGMIDQMLRVGVGVRTFQVAVHCVDEPLFRDLAWEPQARS